MSLHDPEEFDIPPRGFVLAVLPLMWLLIGSVSLFEFCSKLRDAAKPPVANA